MRDLKPRDDLQTACQAFRILCVDGGGVRGAFAAAILEAVEEMFFDGDSLSDYCDLVAGTSTGGLIALSLAFGKRPIDIRIFYQERAKEIFPERCVSYCMSKARQLLFAPYSQNALKKAVESFLDKGKRLGDASVRLVIPTYNATKGNVHVFKHLLAGDEAIVEPQNKNENENERRDYKKYAWKDYQRLDELPVVSVAAATAAAPTFFPAEYIKVHLDEPEAAFIDGGVWANSPIWPAIAEATGPLGKNLDQISILSVGTGFEKVQLGAWRRIGGLLPWNVGVLDLLMNAQAAGAIGGARWVLGSRFVRIDDEKKSPLDPPLSLDRVKTIPDLVRRGKEVVRKIMEDDKNKMDKEKLGELLQVWRAAGRRV
jgi:patatin-like phospholipase/acyl hydrolase